MNNRSPADKVRFLIVLSVGLFIQCGRVENVPATGGWASLPEILARIIPPKFPDRDFSITNFGAKGDGTTDCTEAFRKAIDECNASGGGRVVVPQGVFLTGPIHLKSNVNLHISERAVVKFLTDPKAYANLVSTRWEGVECMNYSPLIYAFEQENIAVTGSGVLEGQASDENWWSWKGNRGERSKGKPNQNNARKSLFAMAEKNVPVGERVFGEGHYLRPNFIQPYRCKNVLIQDVTLKDSPMWFIHPVLCSNVTVQNVTVNGLGPNNDGCNPESSKDVLIKNCFFNTGDDCIAIKSGRNADGRRINVPSENIVIQGCKMKEGHGGVVLGSEISGGVRNVFAEDCTMDSPNLDRALRFKTNSVRGGVMENFFARNIRVGEVGEAVLKIDFFYEEGDAGEFTPVVRNLSISDVTCEKGKYAVWIKGYERSPITSLVLQNCRFRGIEMPNVIEAVDGLSVVDVTLNGKPMQ